MLPFIYTIIANILLDFGIIESIDQLAKCNGIFKPFYIISGVIILLLLLFETGFDFPDAISRIISNIDFSFKKGDSELQFSHIDVPINKEEISKLSKDSKEQAQDQILNGEVKNKNRCDECEINDIKNERESLRYFSAYQITNKYSRNLLQLIKTNGKMEVETFRNNMRDYYIKTIKNMGKKRKEEFIVKKIEEMLYNLRYLNIIEYTEEGKFIILTQNGEDFVKGYSEEVG